MTLPATDRCFDALIVGAGPAGAGTAILLARAGWSVALVEKQHFPRRKVCGECVAASNLPLLDALGVGAAFAAVAGPPLRRVALLRGADAVAADLPAAARAAHPWGRALGRETLDTLLLAQAQAAGATVLAPCSVQDIGGRADGVHRCTVRAPGDGDGASLRSLHARVAILAHGSWEPLPDARALRRERRRGSDLLAFKANFEGATLAAGLLPVLAFTGGYGGMVLGDHGSVTLACCVRRDRLDAWRRAAPAQAAGDVVEAVLRRECAGVAQALRGARRIGAWLASGPLAPGIRIAPGDTLFRVGNAAGEAHPIVGEGMSMALQSAFVLCDELLRRSGPPPLDPADHAAWQQRAQRRYAARWRRHFAMRLRLAAAFAHVAMRPDAARAALALLARWPALLTQAAVWCGKTNSVVDPQTIANLSGRTSEEGHFSYESQSTS